MKKFLKWFVTLAAIGTAIGLIIAYFCKGRCCCGCCEEDQDFEEDDDFDLDSDLEPVADRVYVQVPPNKAADVSSEEKDEAPKKETSSKASAEEKE